MSSLRSEEKIIFERLFNRGGYVLSFNDATFAEFFREHRINIEQNKYLKNGTSKMKRLRAFWELENDLIVGKVLDSLLACACRLEEISANDKNEATKIINRLMGKSTPPRNVSTEQEFLNQNFGDINLDKLKLEPHLRNVIIQRINEIKASLNHNLPLSCIFLCGSTLEGLLLDIAVKSPEIFNSAKSSPKNKEGKVKPHHEWTLEALINVAHEINLLSLDVKKHSHSLRDFRNYIHPWQQMTCKFNPDLHTAKISYQVLMAAVANISGQRSTGL